MNTGAKIENVEFWAGRAGGVPCVYAKLFNPMVSLIQHIVVGVSSVRATDQIRIHFDFGRDGWVIEQPKRLSWAADDSVCDEQWTEVAFCGAWAINEDPEE